MIDIRLLREDPERVRASQRARGEDEGVVDAILAADERRRSALTEFEQMRAQQKAFSKQIGSATAEERPALLEQAKVMSAQVKELEAAAGEAEAEQERLAGGLKNVILDGVPEGGEDDYVVLEEVGTPRDFAAEGFAPRDHEEIGRLTDTIDLEAGAKVAGSRFYYLKGAGARLEQALMAYCQQIAAEEGFVPLVVPNLVSAATMGGTGYLDAHDDVYKLSLDDLYLTGTSEVALLGYHTDQIIDLSKGPLSYTATSTCYRREAGSYGKDTKGIFRVHQFQKTEMVVFCRVEDAEETHARLLRVEKRLLDGLGLPYRVIDVAAGDLGGSAARKFDCEAWYPVQGKYREVTSTSNCTTYQARRLNIRERDPQGGANRFVATLNGTMLTNTRPIVAIYENYQNADGSVTVPEVLRPMMGCEVIPLA